MKLTKFLFTNSQGIQMNWVWTGKESVALGTEFFISISVYSAELLAATNFQWFVLQLAKIALVIYHYVNNHFVSQSNTVPRVLS